MQPHVTLTFHELPHSDAVEAYVRRQIAKLERLSARIIGCHVVLAPSRNHGPNGHEYCVHVDVTVPRGEIVVSRASRDTATNKDLYAAINETFTCLARRLTDHVRYQRGDVKHHGGEDRDGRVSKLWE
jgi:ribosomal subunit interface protein